MELKILFHLLLISFLILLTQSGIQGNSDFLIDNQLKNLAEFNAILSLNDEKFDIFTVLYDILNASLPSYNITIGCKFLLASLFLNYNYSNPSQQTKEKSDSRMYFGKLFGDSGKSKNDLSSYDQCMSKKYRLSNSSFDENLNITYVIIEVDKTNNTVFHKEKTTTTHMHFTTMALATINIAKTPTTSNY